ncbi:transcriptional regulator [Amycolatopsis acidiphila]|nr:transcriptional regulator [Amycolatopsis acidiphila]
MLGVVFVSLRLVFGSSDLAGVRLADGPDPLWELVLALIQAQTRDHRYVAWRRDVHRRLVTARRAGVPAAIGALRELVPPHGDFPDFLTPPSTKDFDVGCEVIAGTPRTRLRIEIAAVFTNRTAPPSVRSLTTDAGTSLGELIEVVRYAHGALLAPYWSSICDAVAAERARRARALTASGAGEFLAGLPGSLLWDGEVLTTGYPVDRTVVLGGRGITVVPTYFCSGDPVTFIDPDLPPVLVCPLADAAGLVDSPPVSAGLARLLGETRACCLDALRTRMTTSELAQRLDITVGAASKHAAVLRQNGLIASTRRGGAVLHQLTRLGAALLAGAEPE